MGVGVGVDGTTSKDMREPIRRGQDRARLREELLRGAKAPLAGSVDAEYFDSLRAGIRKRTTRRPDQPDVGSNFKQI